uniref:Uncharacterized protein n=1 Tax=Bionectria ochroleuca TaxID=29856 RepID=A0A8H7KEA1_BIOOC
MSLYNVRYRPTCSHSVFMYVVLELPKINHRASRCQIGGCKEAKEDVACNCSYQHAPGPQSSPWFQTFHIVTSQMVNYRPIYANPHLTPESEKYRENILNLSI